jgi:hypothetical protein
MADTQVIPWEQVNVDEEITETDQSASDNISVQTPVGQFLCTVTECGAVEKNFKAYSCYAANLKMQIDRVIKIEQTILDNGQPVKRNGEIIKKVQDVPADKTEKINALYVGRFLFDDINLYNPMEKAAMKNRRLYVAKRLQIITPQSTALPTSAWVGAINKQVLVTTEWNSWKDKDTDEVKKNVKIGWSGYDYAKNAGRVDGAVNAGANQSEEFDI